MKFINMLAEDFFCSLISVSYNGFDFIIDLRSNAFGVVTNTAVILPEENLLINAAESDRTEFFTHAVFCNHSSGNLCCSLNII